MAGVILGRRVANPLFAFARRISGANALPASSRLYTSNVQLRDYDEGDEVDDYVGDEQRRSRYGSRRGREGLSGLMQDVFDPFSPSRSLSEMLNLAERLMENPFMSSERAASLRGWDIKADEDGLRLKVDMPGLGKEHVKVWAEQNTLVIKGDAEAEDDGTSPRRYSNRIDIPRDAYRLDGIKAEMKNGVLKVFVPRVKEEERKDVFTVNVE